MNAKNTIWKSIFVSESGAWHHFSTQEMDLAQFLNRELYVQLPEWLAESHATAKFIDCEDNILPYLIKLGFLSVL